MKKKAPPVTVQLEIPYDALNQHDPLHSSYVGKKAFPKQKRVVKRVSLPTTKAKFPKTIKVHVSSEADAKRFGKLIHRALSSEPKARRIAFSAHYDPASRSVKIAKADKKSTWGFTDKRQKVSSARKKKVWNTDWFFDGHWIEMPPFDQEGDPPWMTFSVTFKTEEDFDCFARLVKQRQITASATKAIWFPYKEPASYTKEWWVSEDEKPNQPRYPIFIPSKGRAHEQMTMRTLSRMGLNYYVMVEPQEYTTYRRLLPSEATVLTLAEGNHGNGPGVARNACWDYAKNVLKAERFFVLDDNIDGFYRLHENKRYRCGDGTPFRALEDFVDRYKNVPLAGFQYRFFKPSSLKHYPFTVNTRIYSAALVSTADERFKQRGRYNEDTIQSIDVMKAGLCTVEFNCFLSGKLRTQTMKGGNSDEFYFPQGKRSRAKSTRAKSQMLVNVHGDVCKPNDAYGREHHKCDYRRFEENWLKRTEEWIQKLKQYGKKPWSIDPYKMKLVPILK